MDDYLSKPIRTDALRRIVEHYAAARSTKELPEASGGRSGGEDSWDCDAALARLDGDIDLLRDLAGAFCAESREQLEKLRAAVAEADWAKAQRIAHTLKGSSLIFGAEAASAAAANVELACSRRDAGQASSLLAALRLQVAMLAKSLERFAGSHAA
jgi:HPt (histidine-containing phosphotransfer) domain-containing protein